MFWETLKMALEALLSKKVRTFLSILGIIIGVSTVIVVVGIGAGAKKQIADQYKNLSATTIMVQKKMGREAITSSKLKAEDAAVISSQVPNVQNITTMVASDNTVAYGSESTSLSVIGIQDTFFTITNLELNVGRNLTQEDVDEKNRVAILGVTAFETLFGEDADPTSALEQSVTVGGKKVEIIGVLKENGGSAMGRMSYDNAIFAPYTTAQKSLLGNMSSLAIVIQMDDPANVETGMENITAVLRTEHKLKDSAEDDFMIFDPGSMVEAAQTSANTMSLLLTSVATIVLIVSGVGIMNVMFVTVAERTKEIGIAKAIGAKQKDILLQFLSESVILSIGGGLIGVVIGQIIIPILNRFEDWYVVYSTGGVILAFTFSALVGLFFGFYPALKASRLDPVDALRSE